MLENRSRGFRAGFLAARWLKKKLNDEQPRIEEAVYGPLEEKTQAQIAWLASHQGMSKEALAQSLMKAYLMQKTPLGTFASFVDEIVGRAPDAGRALGKLAAILRQIRGR